MSTNSLLQAAGEALYGPQWQSDLARALGVNDRTVRRWVAGDNDMPAGIIADLSEIVARRIETLEGVARDLDRA